MKHIARIALLALTVSFFMPIANADTDPFPGVAYGAEIGPRQNVSSSTGMPLDGSPIITCPSGSGLGAFAGGGPNYVACTKTWRPSADVQADQDFRSAQDAAVAAATIQSQEWNAAHPGQQKCFQWGPIVHANGVSTASGGVCANPVGVLPPGGGVDTSTPQAPPVSDTSTPAPRVETSTPSPQILSPSGAYAGLGGWAVIDGSGKVYGVIVCDSGVCGPNGQFHGVMSSEYMGCPAGCALVLQTSSDSTGNVSGWHSQEGMLVKYVASQNKFYIYMNGSSTASVMITPPTSSTKSFTTNLAKAESPKESDTKTVGVETKTARVELPGGIAVSDTGTASNQVPDASKADDSALPNLDPEVVADDSISVLSASSKGSVVEISSNFPSTKLTVSATKKGAKKKLIFNVSTNSNGDYKFRTGYNLNGYTVILLNGKTELDRDLFK
jgi:hypothetical protein